MPAIINEIIAKQNFEIVGETIGAILTLELAAQKTIQSLPESLNVFNERIVAVDRTEEVVVNVMLDSITSNYEGQSSQQNKVSYFIDVYANGKANNNDSGSKVSGRKLLKYLGICRYILQSHKYLTLGLPLGTIGGKNVDNVQVFEIENILTSGFERMARINFSVRIMENQKMWDGVLIDQNTTEIQLEETDKGFQYKLK